MIKRLILFCTLLTALLYAQEAVPTDLLEEPAALEYNFKGEFTRMMVILGLIVALIFGTTWVIRRLGKGRMRAFSSNSAIRVLERRAVSPKSCIYLVEVEGTKIVVGDSSGGLTGLAVLSNSPPEPQEPPPKSGFSALLRDKLEKVACK
jgi:flagellar biosynthetic protein FliO